MMKKKNIIGLLVVAVLAGIAIYITQSQNSGTIREELKDFAVKDTASITKIFMADKNEHEILLERQEDNSWLLNGKITARRDAINVLMETIQKITIKSPISKSRFDAVVADLAGVGIKVEIYQGKDKPSKVYYVGTSNQEHTGTYMLLENSSVPFLMHIEGFYGHLRPRYFINENEWKSTQLFSYSYGDINQIKVDYPRSDKKGFTIQALDDNTFELKDENGIVQPNVNLPKLLSYVSSYQKIHFEGAEENFPETYADSLTHSIPTAMLSVTHRNGKRRSIQLHDKPLSSGPVEYEGETIELDLERCHGITHDSSFVVVQYFVFDPLTVDIGYFMN